MLAVSVFGYPLTWSTPLFSLLAPPLLRTSDLIPDARVGVSITIHLCPVNQLLSSVHGTMSALSVISRFGCIYCLRVALFWLDIPFLWFISALSRGQTPLLPPRL